MKTAFLCILWDSPAHMSRGQAKSFSEEAPADTNETDQGLVLGLLRVIRPRAL